MRNNLLRIGLPVPAGAVVTLLPVISQSVLKRESFDHALLSLRTCAQFDARPGQPTNGAVLDLLLDDDGPATVASILEHNSRAIDFLHLALAYLVGADARISAAAEASLHRMGV